MKGSKYEVQYDYSGAPKNKSEVDEVLNKKKGKINSSSFTNSGGGGMISSSITANNISKK